MSKYKRSQPVISTQSSDRDDYWFKKFEETLEKSAVQPRSVDRSLFDQINSIMNNKSKHTSVEAAVEDMKERSGLTAYLTKLNKTSEEVEISSKKIASDNNQAIDKKVDLTPLVIKKFPSIKNTLENYIKDTRGNLPVPAIIDKIRSIHQKDVSESKDWDDDNLIRLVSKLNLQAKSENPDTFKNYENLGTRDIMNDSDIDPSNLDAFHILNPAK